MSEAEQLRTARYVSEISVAKTARRGIDWPVLGVALALVCVVAWDLALLWLAFQLCRIVFL